MSAIKYNPNPTRVWSRVQNRCYTADSTVNYAKIDYDRQMLLKGNILQYKKNSSNLTKNQRYTQIAKGMWTNRTKTWATQSDTYTNPNNSSLLRVNYTILDPSNNTFSSRSNPFNCPTTEIQDGGNLVCNVVVNPCTQEVIKRSVSQQLCNPTTDSDVPGQIQQLCWNDGTQTWYPRQRYTMGNSGTSWPEGYKGFVSAVTFSGPVLSVGTMTCEQTNIPLNWTFENSTCAPITSFNIYQNGVFILNVPVSQTSVTITGNPAGTYMFYVTSVSNSIESQRSNSVSVSTQYGYICDTAVITNNGRTITFLQDGSITFNCSINIKYTLVGGGASGGYDSNLVTGLAAGGGGHVMNSTSAYTMNPGNNLTIAIGAGGLATTSTGAIGGNTSINGTFSIITTNSTYGGGGGGGAKNLAYSGGGGSGNGTTSNLGGIYWDYSSGTYNNNGTGGAGGSLTTELITLTTLGNIGGSNSKTDAGNGGNGQLGIDGIQYGGGGGGGIRYVENTLVLCGGGTGGLGGGGGGATPSSSAIPGTPNTGGGGGGGYYVNTSRPYPSAIGGSGIAIIMIQ